MTQQERYKKMTETPVAPLISKLAVPTIISMLVTSIYNMADTYYVGLLSTEASAAVGVAFSVMAMIQAIGFMIGMGSGNFVSRLLGMKEVETAERTVATAFFTAAACGILFAVAGLSNLDALVILLGAIDTVQPFAVDYIFYILLAAPVMMTSFVLNNQLRAQGCALFSMIGIGTGGLVNLALDPLFIFAFDMGVSGAALATMLSQCVSFCLLLLFNNVFSGAIKLRPSRFRPSLHIYKEIFVTGMPSFFRQGLGSVSTVVLNLQAGPYGAAAMSAMSIVNRIMMFIYSGLIGFAQGFQPVCGFNFGAGKYKRVREAFYFSLKVALVFLTTLGVVAFVFAPSILTVFRRGDPEVIEIGALALRLQCLTLPFQALMIMSQFLAQSIGYGFRASLVAMGRQGLFLIPLYYILPYFFDLAGIQAAQPSSDLFTAVIAAIVVTGVLKKLKTLETERPETPEVPDAAAPR